MTSSIQSAVTAFNETLFGPPDRVGFSVNTTRNFEKDEGLTLSFDYTAPGMMMGESSKGNVSVVVRNPGIRQRTLVSSGYLPKFKGAEKMTVTATRVDGITGAEEQIGKTQTLQPTRTKYEGRLPGNIQVKLGDDGVEMSTTIAHDRNWTEVREDCVEDTKMFCTGLGGLAKDAFVVTKDFTKAFFSRTDAAVMVDKQD